VSAKTLLARAPDLLSEAQFSGLVVEVAKLGHWPLRYHTLRSKGSKSGFPDWVFARVSPLPRIVFAELKSESGQVRPAQAEWLHGLAEIAELLALTCGIDHPPFPIEVHVWRPSDWPNVVETLTGKRPREEAA
jgi:hypothetical protein